MAPQTHIPIAANVLGTLGTVFWCIQLIPQIWQNWRRKKTEGVPAIMMLLWATSAVPFGVYAVVQNFNIPIQIQAQVFGTLSLITWAQILIYTGKWPLWKATAVAGGLFVMFAGLETLLILTLRGPYDRGLNWPIVLLGSIAAVLLLGGILPPYPEIWKRGGRVVGINFVFLAMDSLGADFSLFALVAQEHFDILGGFIYIAVIVLEAGIFLSHIIWLFRTRALRKRAKREGKHFDDLPEARRWQHNHHSEEETSNHRRSRSASAEKDLELGMKTGGELVVTEPGARRDSEVECAARLKEVGNRQSAMTAADDGFAKAEDDVCDGRHTVPKDAQTEESEENDEDETRQYILSLMQVLSTGVFAGDGGDGINTIGGVEQPRDTLKKQED